MSLDLRLLTDRDRQALEHTALVRRRLEEPYENLEQQGDTASLGMWLFLATEVMFFGTLFTILGIYRFLYAEAFEQASVRLNWQVGTINTVVLLVSSLMMALAVHHARLGRQQALVLFLMLTAALGACFLGLKGYEYYQDVREGLVLGTRFRSEEWTGERGLSAQQVPHVQLFLLLYWIMTATHAVHMILGIAAVLVMVVLARRNCFDASYYSPVEVTGLYWHFVDLVWIFLFPMLYLLGTHR